MFWCGFRQMKELQEFPRLRLGRRYTEKPKGQSSPSWINTWGRTWSVGKDPFLLEEIHSKLDHIPYKFCAKGAIDITLHDILGKWMKIPIYKLLGGETKETVSLSWVVGINSREKMVQERERFMKMGIQALKIKAGLNYDEELETFVAIRKALGEEAGKAT
jgi:L-alanine-DL-glutamate epimerase-like enolase superfamily enzyme